MPASHKKLYQHIMKTSYNFPTQAHGLKMILILFVVFASTQIRAQNFNVIKGTVKTAEDKQPLPGANIYLKSLSSVGTFSDGKGEFEFPRLLQKGDTLVFSFLGLKTTEYGVPDQPVTSLVIEMEFDAIQMVDEILVETNETQAAVLPTRARKQKIHR
jgi:hypothetical protein